MGRAPCCDKVGLKRGPWTAEEDQVLISFIRQHGHSNWRALPKQSGLLRCGKSCRLRWINYLRPDIKRGNFSKEEEDTIIQLHEMMGNRWSAIAARLPGRTDNEIKNVWHTHLKKRLNKQHDQTPKLQGNVTLKKHCDGAKNNNNNRTTSNSTNNSANNFSDISVGTSYQAPNSSQQSYSSDDFSSLTEVSSVEEVILPSEHVTITGFSSTAQKSDDFVKETNSDEEELPIIDETFWSTQDYSHDDVSMDFIFPDIIEDDRVQSSSLSSWTNYYSSMYIENNNEGPLHQEGSVDFWLDVFVRAGGAPELPEF